MEGSVPESIIPPRPWPPVSEPTLTPEESKTEIASADKQWQAAINDLDIRGTDQSVAYLKVLRLGSEALADNLKAGVNLRTNPIASSFIIAGNTVSSQAVSQPFMNNSTQQVLLSPNGKAALLLTSKGQLQLWHDGKKTDLSSRVVSQPTLQAVSKESPNQQWISQEDGNFNVTWTGKELKIQEWTENVNKGKDKNTYPTIPGPSKTIATISEEKLTSLSNGLVSVNKDGTLVLHDPPPTGLLHEIRHLWDDII
jgi:hypothetical protein